MSRYLLLVLLLAPAMASASRSSYGTDGSGSKVFYLLLEELSYRTQRVFDIDEVDPASQLLVVIGVPESKRDGARWLSWVQGGKALLIAPPLEAEQGYCSNYKLGATEIARSVLLKELEKPLPESTVPNQQLKLRPSVCLLKAPPASTVLAGRPDQALAFEQATGQGRLLVLAHEDLLSNLHLDTDDTAVLIRRWLAAHLPAGTLITFVEERQGGQLVELLKSTNLTIVALHALAWLLLLYWLLTPRFGDGFLPLSSPRRAFAQHARALGALYRHRGASATMLRHQFDRFVSKLIGRTERKKLQVVPRRSEPRRPSRLALASAVATRTGRDADSVESLLAQLDTAMLADAAQDLKLVQRHFRLSQSLAAISRVSAARALGGSRARKGRSGIR